MAYPKNNITKYAKFALIGIGGFVALRFVIAKIKAAKAASAAA